MNKQIYRIAVIPGDGIGPEVVASAISVLKMVTTKLEYLYFEAGYERYKAKGEAITDAMIEELKTFDAILFGAVSSTPGNVKNYRSAILTMRKELDLYANIRPVKSHIKKNNLDMVIFRENTEGLYSRKTYMREKEAVAEKIVTEEKSERIARLAFQKAQEWGRKKVTIVHKANVLRLTDGLFLDVCKRVAGEFSGIAHDELYIDNTCYQLVRNPSQFDIVVTMNMYGDILADVGAGVADGLGVAPSGQIGDRWALFEPVHGSAPDLAGKHLANPMAQILSAKMMLEYLGLKNEATYVQEAVESVLTEGRVRTQDIGGKATTEEMTASILKELSARVKS